VSKLGFKPHVTVGVGGFVDITARARKIVFSGFFTAGAGLDVVDGALVIRKEGKVKKPGGVRRADLLRRAARGRAGPGSHLHDERCVMELTRHGIAVTEIAPGVDLDRDVLAQANFSLRVPTAPA
jgi:acyl CoA:acetate/3-ketoacid CoA transferase